MNNDSNCGVTGVFASNHYFKKQDTVFYSDLFIDESPVWMVLDRLNGVMKSFFKHTEPAGVMVPDIHVKLWTNRENKSEKLVSFEKGFYAGSDLVWSNHELAFGCGSTVEPGVVIKPPLIVGRNTEIRQGAYIRGGVIIGDFCTIGHSTEVKTAIVLHHSEAGHFAYIGDSVIGSYVNMGAGTRLANLPFRSLTQKQNKTFDYIKIKHEDKTVSSQRCKFGAILGDGVETGCNSVLAPGSFIGPNSWIYPCVFVKSGYYPANSIIKTDIRPDSRTKVKDQC
jgi:NDP-sugar pyrophosphorylase family protein